MLLRHLSILSSSLSSLPFGISRNISAKTTAWPATTACALLLAAIAAVPAQDTRYPPKEGQIPVPSCLEEAWVPTSQKLCNDQPRNCIDQLRQCAQELRSWRADVFHWRDETRIRAGYNPSEYERPELKWAQTSFMQPQAMMEDRFLFDPVTGKYTVDRYLEDVNRRFGGIDAVLLWQSYPNIGVDNRNQYDLLRALPGGIPAIRAAIDEFHKHGVRVLFPVMLWDQGTRDEGISNEEATAKLLAEVGADGVNGDTMNGFPRAFREASDKTGHPLVLEPEGYPASAEMLAYNSMNWGYWQYPFTPLVSEGKLLEPRHMVNISDRWARSKTDDLQFAFFNGSGLETWENIWSIWNGITPRGAESIRRVAAVERAAAPFLISQHWQPLYPTLQFGVFASEWPLGEETLFTLVNRNEYDLTGPQIELAYRSGLHYYDLWHGKELKPGASGDVITLDFDIEQHGYGAILVTPKLQSTSIEALMRTSTHWAETPLASLSDQWKPIPQQLIPMTAIEHPKSDPPQMLKIPEADFLFRVNGIEIEGDNWAGLDVQYPWEDSPRRHHLHMIHIKSFWIDKYPVTNAEFKKFLDATHYHPRDDYNFLKDWSNGSYPEGWENKPVTWVSGEDAHAYARWAGKRLPHEWEWQYAATGSDDRLYPWGHYWNDAAVPIPDRTRNLTSPDPVDAHPEGASPFGVMDMVGNVWQWTDEYQDEHTRAAILRGGSYYQPQGSMWYFPRAVRNTEHGKYLLMAPSKDRAGTVGFRCVIDTE
jgi:iron(II)-dependent oxidoreductase